MTADENGKIWLVGQTAYLRSRRYASREVFEVTVTDVSTYSIGFRYPCGLRGRATPALLVESVPAGFRSVVVS